jgi:hypothetical protein
LIVFGVPQRLGVELLLQVVGDTLDTDGGLESFPVGSRQVLFGWSHRQLLETPSNYCTDDCHQADQGEDCLQEAHQDCPPE